MGMTLKIKTEDPSLLKEGIIRLIEDGELRTWTIYTEKNIQYLRHTGQWGEKGVILLKIDQPDEMMLVQVLKFTSFEDEVENFEGYYLGRFCELLFVNFPDSFTGMNKI